jgi:hypothetical protein
MKFIANILVFSLLLVSITTLSDTIEIINNSDQSLKITHAVSEYTKATINFTKLEQNIHHNEYQIIALPEDFLSCDEGYSLNNLGQVAGFIHNEKNPPFKRNTLQHNGSPLQSASEKSNGCQAAVWSLVDGLITSKLKNSRAVALNDTGFAAISRSSDLPFPDVLWDLKNNEFVAGPKWTDKENIGNRKIKVSIYDHMNRVIDVNEKGSSLTITHNPFDPQNEPEFILHHSGKYIIIPFEHGPDINTKRLRTALPIVSARLNGNDQVVAILKINDKQAIGNWVKKDGITISSCLQDNPHLKEYTNFSLCGFNNQGQILIRADTNSRNELEYKPVKPRMFLLIPK